MAEVWRRVVDGFGPVIAAVLGLVGTVYGAWSAFRGVRVQAQAKRDEERRAQETSLQQIVAEHVKYLMSEQQRRIDTLHARVETVEHEREEERKEYARILKQRDGRIEELQTEVDQLRSRVRHLEAELEQRTPDVRAVQRNRESEG